MNDDNNHYCRCDDRHSFIMVILRHPRAASRCAHSASIAIAGHQSSRESVMCVQSRCVVPLFELSRCLTKSAGAARALWLSILTFSMIRVNPAATNLHSSTIILCCREQRREPWILLIAVPSLSVLVPRRTRTRPTRRTLSSRCNLNSSSKEKNVSLFIVTAVVRFLSCSK